jgi:hypothetical protein
MRAHINARTADDLSAPDAVLCTSRIRLTLKALQSSFGHDLSVQRACWIMIACSCCSFLTVTCHVSARDIYKFVAKNQGLNRDAFSTFARVRPVYLRQYLV